MREQMYKKGFSLSPVYLPVPYSNIPYCPSYAFPVSIFPAYLLGLFGPWRCSSIPSRFVRVSLSVLYTRSFQYSQGCAKATCQYRPIIWLVGTVMVSSRQLNCLKTWWSGREIPASLPLSTIALHYAALIKFRIICVTHPTTYTTLLENCLR